MTTPTPDTAALVAEADVLRDEYRKRTNALAPLSERAVIDAVDILVTADRVQSCMTRLAAALEAETARANTLDLQLVEAMNIAAGGLYVGSDGETWSERVNDLDKDNRRLREALEWYAKDTTAMGERARAALGDTGHD